MLRHEKEPSARFISAWSKLGLETAAQHGLSKQDLHKTYLVVVDGQGLTQSDAGLAIVRSLRFPWSALAVLRFVPRPVRDAVYRMVARNRYRWFGHKPACFVPPAASRHRFVDAQRSTRT